MEVMMTTPVNTADDWYLVSRATNHLTSNLQNLCFQYEYNGIDQVKVSNDMLARSIIGFGNSPHSKISGMRDPKMEIEFAVTAPRSLEKEKCDIDGLGLGLNLQRGYIGLEKQSSQLSVDPPVQKQHPHTSATNIQQPNPNPAMMNPKEVGLPQKTKWIEPVRVYQRRKGRANWATYMEILTLLPRTQDPTIDKEQLDSFSEKEGTAGRDWNAKETNTTTAIADSDGDDAGILAGARPTEKATTARDAKEATYTAGRGKSDHIEVIDLDSE
uniref:Uncharacterized protein n=1 Tax=Ananas comosus var. bracteatus TaxID=296719 RepID=A0A6V7QJV7_ANACO|nr:unnamed protein product [Ananas comosus var. bracteatus]